MSAPYIVVEGCDGAGKSSLLIQLGYRLFDAGRAPTARYEPNNRLAVTGFSKTLGGGDARALAYEADRLGLEPGIAERLEAGQPVLQDRSLYSTLAYQDPSPAVRNFILRQRRIEPDLILLLDAPARDLRERLEGRGDLDEYEESIDFQESARWRYRQLLCANPKAVLLDAMRPTRELVEEVWPLVDKLLDAPVKA